MILPEFLLLKLGSISVMSSYQVTIYDVGMCTTMHFVFFADSFLFCHFFLGNKKNCFISSRIIHFHIK